MPTADIEFSGVLGGRNSQLGLLCAGYDADNYVIVDWIGNISPELASTLQSFGTDEGGHPILLPFNKPTTLRKDQVELALGNGAVLIEAARWESGGGIIFIYNEEQIIVTDVANATVRRTNVESWTISDSTSRSARHSIRNATEAISVGDFSIPSGTHNRGPVDSVSVSDTAVIAVTTYASQVGFDRAQPGSIYQPASQP